MNGSFLCVVVLAYLCGDEGESCIIFVLKMQSLLFVCFSVLRVVLFFLQAEGIPPPPTKEEVKGWNLLGKKKDKKERPQGPERPPVAEPQPAVIQPATIQPGVAQPFAV